MKIDYLNIAFNALIKPYSLKFTLVAIASESNEEGKSSVSLSDLEEKTSLKRKTLLSNIEKLIETGFISDAGSNKQETVYQLNKETIEEAGKGNKQ